MQILTKETLDAAIQKCQGSARYRVIIVTEHQESHQDILDYLSKFEHETLCRHQEPYVKFSNGSVIRMLSASSSLTGRMSNLVLCIEKYFNDKTSEKLKSLEISYHMKGNKNG